MPVKVEVLGLVRTSKAQPF